MGEVMDFKVPFRGIKEGKHQLEFAIEDKFFEQFEESDIHKGDLKVEVELIKRSTGIETTYTINGEVVVACDRCLDDLTQEITYNGKLYFEYGDETREVTDELVVLSAAENYIDLSRYIFEFINLSLPLQKVHPENEEGESLCNSEMLERLSGMYVSKEEEDEIDDPRWDKLKDLMN